MGPQLLSPRLQHLIRHSPRRQLPVESQSQRAAKCPRAHTRRIYTLLRILAVFIPSSLQRTGAAASFRCTTGFWPSVLPPTICRACLGPKPTAVQSWKNRYSHIFCENPVTPDSTPAFHRPPLQPPYFNKRVAAVASTVTWAETRAQKRMLQMPSCCWMTMSDASGCSSTLRLSAQLKKPGGACSPSSRTLRARNAVRSSSRKVVLWMTAAWARISRGWA